MSTILRATCAAWLLLVGCGSASSSDAGAESGPTDDAYATPVERLYLNTAPPQCLDRDQPPIWRVTTVPAMRGTILWDRALEEEQFERWRDLASDEWLGTPPSLSGDGIATWFFWREETSEQWALGLGARPSLTCHLDPRVI